jgi:hypothetical protein
MSEPTPAYRVYKWVGDQPPDFRADSPTAIADAMTYENCIEIVGWNIGETPRIIYKRGTENV